MARTNTLSNFLTDVANAIRNKKGTTDAIVASNFDTEIESIEGGSGKYAPRYISFYNYDGTDLNDELNNLDTSNMTSMAYMFYNCTKVTKLDVSKLNTSNVTTMNSMFYGCKTITELDISKLDTTNLTNVRNMFCDCSKLKAINFGNLNTSGASDLSYMFARCKALNEMDLSLFDFSNITYFQEMFVSCSTLKTVIFPPNMAKTSYLKETFSHCSAITHIDISGVTSVSNWYRTFYGCNSLTHLDMRNIDMSSSKPNSQTFSGVPAGCEIIVKDDTARDAILAIRSDFTNIKTVAELTE